MNPICKPAVDDQLHRMNALQRTVESFRYVLLCIEHWVSPDGRLRTWLRHNLRLTLFVAVPAFILFPVVTLALWELSSLLSSIVGKFILLPVLVVLSIAIGRKIIRVFKP